MTGRIAGGLIFAVTSAATTFGLIFIFLAPYEHLPAGLRPEDVARFVPLQISLTAVAALIVWRRPENRIGWFLSLAAIGNALLIFELGYAVYGLLSEPRLPGPLIAAWLFTWGGGALPMGLGLVALSFPDGSLRSGTSKIGAVLAVVATALATLLLATRPGVLFNFPLTNNPFGIEAVGRVEGPLIIITALLILGTAGCVVAALSARFRRSVGVQRQQIKWMLAAGLAFSGSMVPGLPLFFLDFETAKNILSVVLSLMPLAVGIAILRHRLYDIDVVIHRTLIYGAVSTILIATYVVGVVLLQALLRPFTSRSELAVAGSTLLVVALFQPLRSRIQEFVDRRFYRSRYDAARTLDSFSARLRNEVELDSVRADLLGVVGETVQPTHASVWLRTRAS